MPRFFFFLRAVCYFVFCAFFFSSFPPKMMHIFSPRLFFTPVYNSDPTTAVSTSHKILIWAPRRPARRHISPTDAHTGGGVVGLALAFVCVCVCVIFFFFFFLFCLRVRNGYTSLWYLPEPSHDKPKRAKVILEREKRGSALFVCLLFFPSFFLLAVFRQYSRSYHPPCIEVQAGCKSWQRGAREGNFS